MKSPRINVLLPWTHNCGIMIYWLRIDKELKKYQKTNIIKNTSTASMNPFYFISLANKAKKCDLLHIQHNYNVFGSFLGKFNSTFAWLFYFLLKFPKGPKVITTLHDIVEPKHLSLLKKIYLKFMNFPVNRFSDKIIVHEANSENTLIRQGFDKNKIVRIPHGITDVEHLLSKTEARKRFNIPNKKTIMLYGWVKKIKQYEKVIDSLEYLDDVQVMILGNPLDEEYYEFLLNYVKEKNVEDKVIFRQNVNTDAIFQWLRCADIVVLPYSRITASGALSDSISAHLPIITSKIPEFAQYEKEWHVVKTADVDSPKKLADTIKNVLKNPHQLDKHLIKFIKHNNRDVIARRTKKLYEEVLNE
ncbi:glycosyltransferase [Candidatus Woesearchaeota archaeon]|nr:glycosyltransferase [Candidatus Woesearchaeota archaeon]